MYKILVLEDDKLFAETLEDFLEDEGFNIDLAFDGEEVLALTYENNYDLYLFDINVPKLNGLEVLKELRQVGDVTPSIYLTSYKDKETLQNGFLNGCDDYIKKPVDLDELLLRIKTILKRCGKAISKVELSQDLVFDPNTKRVYKDGKDLNIASKVIDLLELFIQNKENIVTKEMIINKLWSYEESYSEGSIRVYINSLKKFLGKDSITNIKGIGYKLEL